MSADPDDNDCRGGVFAAIFWVVLGWAVVLWVGWLVWSRLQPGGE